jgi:hypothetical protein
MNFDLKSYKAFKTSKFLKENKYISIYFCSNFNFEDWINIERNLHKNNLKYHRIFNRIVIKQLEKSILKNYKFLINGPILLVALHNNKDIQLKQCLKLNPKLNFLGFKIKSKIYTKVQLEKNVFLFKNKSKYIKVLNSIQSNYFKFYKNLCVYIHSKKNCQK